MEELDGMIDNPLVARFRHSMMMTFFTIRLAQVYDNQYGIGQSKLADSSSVMVAVVVGDVEELEEEAVWYDGGYSCEAWGPV